jgi:TolB-like protein
MAIFRELKRRKVLHTLSLYVVGCWVALQVVEVLSDAGLPPGTMRQVLWAMTAFFPFVLVLAWFFDISASGISRTAGAARDTEFPQVNLGDHAILAGLLVVVAFTAYVLSLPVLVDGVAETQQRVLVVMPFEDIDVSSDDERVGDAIAQELREELSRIAGLKVFGEETSRVIQLAGEERNVVATELGVTSILMGNISLGKGHLEVDAHMVSLPAGNIVWRELRQGDIHDGAAMQRSIVQALIDAILPAASAQTTHAPRIRGDECGKGYELYLRGKQLRASRNYERGQELLQESVQIDPDCAVAWETLAASSLWLWRKSDLAKAGAAARRALELNESMPKAWVVLAEIAEEEERWGEAEELLLRALYVDPTSAFANMQYAEALLARGRVREARHYALEAYRYDPASHGVNWKVALVARYLEDTETLIKHANIYRELRGDGRYNGWDELGEAYRLLGEVERALDYWGEAEDIAPDWYPRCVRASLDPSLGEGLAPRVRATVRKYLDGTESQQAIWWAIRCATWIGEADIVVQILEQDKDIPTEAMMMFFSADASVLRETEYFRRRVVESGLLDYWREWGWSDYCRPDGDSFVCD